MSWVTTVSWKQLHFFQFFSPHSYYWQTAQVTVTPAALLTRWVILSLSQKMPHMTVTWKNIMILFPIFLLVTYCEEFPTYVWTDGILKERIKYLCILEQIFSFISTELKIIKSVFFNRQFACLCTKTLTVISQHLHLPLFQMYELWIHLINTLLKTDPSKNIALQMK